MNHYDILELRPSATQREIKHSYRRLAKQFHPDTQTDQASHEKIIAINAAYEILSDPHRRHQYDQELQGVGFSRSRDQRQQQARQAYRHGRQARQDADARLQQWLAQVYAPLAKQLWQVVQSLDEQIDALAADPFDDQLMETFQAYLAACASTLSQARTCFTSQASPTNLAKVAAFLYYCLNHLDDALEELELFTLNYDDAGLHTGQELFRLAEALLIDARATVANLH
ncbi:DnaJ domain-containing protein [Synechocystis sp. LKSZ1]|uniref:J domain-containing protein n=1 Tax=Synechocystis sp. LKSZ1 TaxID=3144951 RepID=UPI00336BD1E2